MTTPTMHSVQKMNEFTLCGCELGFSLPPYDWQNAPSTTLSNTLPGLPKPTARRHEHRSPHRGGVTHPTLAVHGTNCGWAGVYVRPTRHTV